MKARWTKIGVLWKGKEAGKLPSGRPDGLLAAILPDGARLVLITNERKQSANDPDYEVMIVVDSDEAQKKQARPDAAKPVFSNDPPF